MADYDAAITADWGDGAHVFRLGIGEIRELQDKCGCGIYELYRRVVTQSWRIDDLREVYRVSLIGGGEMKAIPALKLVDRYFVAPFADHWLLAVNILGRALVKPDDEPEAKPAKKKPSRKSKATASTSASSTDSAP